MRETVAYRLARQGIELPPSALSAGLFRPWRRSGDLLLLGGQLGPAEGPLGRLGRDLGVAQGQAAARRAALRLLAHAREALEGDLERVEACLKLGVFINAAPEFYEHGAVADGASEILTAAFGAAGRHSRSAVGVVALPYGAAVAVEAILRVH